MAVDFNILARVPTIGSQIMAGQEAGREAAARNMLLQQRQLEFQQAQEDRQRRLREERIFEDAAQMIRQSGLDPDDPKVLQQFTAAAVQSRNPQLMSLATSMSERLAKRRQEQKDAAAVAAIAARRRGEAPAGAPTPPAAAELGVAPMAAPVAAAAPQEVSALAAEQAAYPRPAFYAQGQFVGGGPAAVTSPVGEFPTEPAPPVNAMAPVAPVVNRMMAAPAPAPAVQVAGPAAMPAAPKVDVDKLQKQLDDLQEDYDEYSGLGTEEGRKAAAALKPQMGRLERQIRDANKAEERANKERAEKTTSDWTNYQRLKEEDPSLTFTRYMASKKPEAPKVDVKVQAFTPASERAQETLMAALTDERKALRNAPMMIKNVEAARQLIPGASAFMGKGGEPFLALASFLNNRLGFSFNTKGVADATELNTRLFEGILENLKKLDSQPTVQQQNALKEALGSLNTDPGALPRILDRIEDSLRDRVDQFNQDVASARENKVLFPLDPTIKLPPRVRPAAIPTAPAAVPAPAPATARALTAEDKQALEWANKNPSDPRAAQIKQRLGM